MPGLLRKTKPFTIPFLCMVAICSALLLIFNKIEIELWINAHNTYALDLFFKYFTHLGDGLTATLLSLVFLMFNIRKGLILLITYLLSGLIIQMLKIHYFDDILRPISIIEVTPAIHLVDGVRLWAIQSFPSGHSGTAFSMFFCIAAFSHNRGIQTAAFLTAALLAYSRLYLFQHFLPDVVAGAVIGTLTSLVILAGIGHFHIFGRLDRSVFSFKGSHVSARN